MLTSEVYGTDVKKISNDVIMAMLGATDTSRNITFLALCHLTKNAKSKESVRNEIKKGLEKQNLTDVLKLSHKCTTATDFDYLHKVINECLRYNPPVNTTD